MFIAQTLTDQGLVLTVLKVIIDGLKNSPELLFWITIILSLLIILAYLFLKSNKIITLIIKGIQDLQKEKIEIKKQEMLHEQKMKDNQLEHEQRLKEIELKYQKEEKDRKFKRDDIYAEASRDMAKSTKEISNTLGNLKEVLIKQTNTIEDLSRIIEDQTQVIEDQTKLIKNLKEKEEDILNAFENRCINHQFSLCEDVKSLEIDEDEREYLETKIKNPPRLRID